MALDLAIDYNTGDLLISPNNDLDLRVGQQTIEQRIRVRLLIQQGAWIFDPSGGTLGSHLRSATRLPIKQAIPIVEQMVREALLPMTDISVVDVIAELDPDNPTMLGVTIEYSILEQGGTMSDLVYSTTMTIQGF